MSESIETSSSSGAMLVGVDTAKKIYVDGLAQIMFGFPNSKLIFHTVEEGSSPSNNGVERRKAEVVLVMPTPALIENSQLVLELAKNSENQLNGFIELVGARTKELLEQLRADNQQQAK